MLFCGAFCKATFACTLIVAHSRTASAVISLLIGSFFIGVHGPESMLGLCGTRTQTDGTGAMYWCWFDDVLLFVVTIVCGIWIAFVTWLFSRKRFFDLIFRYCFFLSFVHFFKPVSLHVSEICRRDAIISI